MKRLIALFLLAGCGTVTEAEPPVSLIEPPIPPPTLVPAILTIDASTPVMIEALPERLPAVQATDTLPPPPTTIPKTPQEIVNGLWYDYVDGKDQAMMAFAIVAKYNGWSDQKIQSWAAFANDVIGKESGYCWNVLGGAIVSTNGCAISRQGTGSDAGFGQLTSVHHGPGMWLCEIYGVCGRHAVIRDPWTSMSSVVWLFDREGSQPWCYSDWARGFHRCGLAPDR